ncbi:MAG: hypothetical protein R3C11_23335 [Planctomycetaceae bacterium]
MDLLQESRIGDLYPELFDKGPFWMRSIAIQLGILIGICLSASGCMNPNMRWPNLNIPNVLAERRIMERNDPFPDEDIAPETYLRPRSFIDQRTEERQAAEQRMFEGVIPGQSLGPRAPSTTWRNSQVVRP